MEVAAVSLARATAVDSISRACSKRLGSASTVSTPFSVLPLLSPQSPSHHQLFASAKLATTPAAAAATAMGKKSAGLIEPDGGVLVDLHVPESERDSKRAEAMTLPKIQLGRVDLEWVHTVAEGWASPLKGFMRQSEYLQSLHFNCLRLPDGSFTNMSLPIVLAINDEQKSSFSGVTAVTLVAPDGKDVAILRKYATALKCCKLAP